MLWFKRTERWKADIQEEHHNSLGAALFYLLINFSRYHARLYEFIIAPNQLSLRLNRFGLYGRERHFILGI
jgi:hypothetical protein